MMPSTTALSQREVLRSSSTATWKPSSTGPIGHPSASSKSISAEASARVPSLSFSRRMREPVGRRPVEAARDGEAAEPPGAVGRSLGTGGDDEQVGVGHRAEPLLTAETPGASRWGRARPVSRWRRRPNHPGPRSGTASARRDDVDSRSCSPGRKRSWSAASARCSRARRAGRAHHRAGVPTFAAVREQVEERGQLEGGGAVRAAASIPDAQTARPASS